MMTLLVAATAAQPLNIKAAKVRKVVIDAGHGGHDPGCIGKAGRTKEKDITFDIAMQLGALIKAHLKDVTVVYTRKHPDEFVELRERARIANKSKADVFISIHCNAHVKPDAFGTETFVMGLGASGENFQVAMRENSVILQEEGYEQHYDGFDPASPVSYILLANYQQSYQASSLRLAAKIEEQFGKKFNRLSRGVKQEGFLVLAHTAMPSVLVETGFLSNKAEEAYLVSPYGKAAAAAAIYRALRAYKQEMEGGQAQ